MVKQLMNNILSLKKPYILGIDPGVSGALALLDPNNNELIKVWDFPTALHGVGGKKIINPHFLAVDLLTHMDDIALAIVEDVHAMPGQGVTSMFSFGVSKGLVIGMLSMASIPTFFTPPSVWKSVYGLSKDKNASRALASKKYPSYSHHWPLKKHDGRAEAVLLADFGRRFY